MEVGGEVTAYFFSVTVSIVFDTRATARRAHARSRLPRCRSARLVSPFLLPRRRSWSSPNATSRFFPPRCQNLFVHRGGCCSKQCAPREWCRGISGIRNGPPVLGQRPL